MNGTFKGAILSTKGIVIEKIDWFKKPQRRNDVKLINGVHGGMIVEYGYSPMVVTMNVGLTDMAKLDEVMALLDGAGILTFSGDSGKYRNANVLEQVDYDKLLRFRKASIDFFIADPFRYVVGEADLTFTTFPQTITNTGTFQSLPLLKLTGSGAISITLNGTTFTYTFPSGETYVWIDCKEQVAYYSSPVDYRDGSMSGNYPTLAIGSNTLAKTGTLTQVVVTKRTCFL